MKFRSGQAGLKTLEEAIRRSEKHLIDVGKGRIRLGMSPDEVDEYIQGEMRRLQTLKSRRLVL